MNDTTAIDAAVAAAGELLDIDGVHGVGQGESEGSPSILVMVAGLDDVTRATLPTEVNGFPVVVFDVGEPPTILESAAEATLEMDIEPDCG
jgi:hypothetical protein